ncbi:MAG: hypothetical protein ACYSWO_18870, partial [Planctomycetota bacterium]|jgi:hypothetical protein
VPNKPGQDPAQVLLQAPAQAHRNEKLRDPTYKTYQFTLPVSSLMLKTTIYYERALRVCPIFQKMKKNTLTD